jgi:outer membrane autotransporter protein
MNACARVPRPSDDHVLVNDHLLPLRAALKRQLGGDQARVSATVNRTTALYANASYQTGLDGRSFAYNGKVGVRANW